jgi:hypothetical protein
MNEESKTPIKYKEQKNRLRLKDIIKSTINSYRDKSLIDYFDKAIKLITINKPNNNKDKLNINNNDNDKDNENNKIHPLYNLNESEIDIINED